MNTLRLWDKEFNLLATWKAGEDVFFTDDDEGGLRLAGKVTEIKFSPYPGGSGR